MQWDANWREKTWATLPATAWDIIIIGGGITGAGLLQEASKRGYRTLLVEQRDFAWGTSSRSSKMVHGGLRYLKQGNLPLVVESVRERETLLKTLPGLVEPLNFLSPVYAANAGDKRTYRLGLGLYDLIAGRRNYRYYNVEQLEWLAPRLKKQELEGAFQFGDAQTDDARLVLRIIREAARLGGTPLNYTRAVRLLRQGENGPVCGVELEDTDNGRRVELQSKVVINATGAWSDQLRSQIGQPAKLRPLRGSHLVFERWRLPVAQVISFSHPRDGRPVFVYPWESVTIVGTTDLDHQNDLNREPAITPTEVSYLMAAAEFVFPALKLGLNDIISSWAGVRPVVAGGQADPSKESRDSVIWQEQGLLTVTGGKLTTFRVVARQTLNTIKDKLPPKIENRLSPNGGKSKIENLIVPAALSHLNSAAQRRLTGRYGPDLAELVATTQPEKLAQIPGTPYLWAELSWAARAEAVRHLDDLLLRRVRLGMLLPGGGEALLPQIRQLCQPLLGWDDNRWQKEEAAYLELWHNSYSLPDPALIPDWKSQSVVPATVSVKKASRKRQPLWLAGIGLSLAGGWLFSRQLSKQREHNYKTKLAQML